MSFNDFFDSEFGIPLLIVICLLVFVSVPVMISKTEKKVYGDNKDVSQKKQLMATVIEKRVENNYLTQNAKVNVIVFEFENGERLQLSLRDASTIVVGDKGLLTYSGNHFISFSREV